MSNKDETEFDPLKFLCTFLATLILVLGLLFFLQPPINAATPCLNADESDTMLRKITNHLILRNDKLRSQIQLLRGQMAAMQDSIVQQPVHSTIYTID